jgi:hypothetical protein
MFCPQCGTNQAEDLKFCKSCGANLFAVRQVVTARDTGDKFDWSKTWVTEMFLSHEERKRRKQELQRARGITPEVKRCNEIKAGVITSCVGIGLMIFLYVLMQGVILGGNIPPNAVDIISRIWIVGVIPFFVGLGLLINGVIVSKRLVEIYNRELERKERPDALDSTIKSKEDASLSSADWYESDSPRSSVTENTTRQLRDSS